MADQGLSFPVREDQVLNHHSGLNEQHEGTTVKALNFVLGLLVSSSVAIKSRFWKKKSNEQHATPSLNPLQLFAERAPRFQLAGGRRQQMASLHNTSAARQQP